MALLRSFTRTRGNARPHPSAVDCHWQIVADGAGDVLLQLSTYGSDTRASQPKVSQTIQIDKTTAALLAAALNEAFPALK